MVIQYIYIYDLTCTILYYHSLSIIHLKRVLNIHPDSCNKYVESKIPSLGSFILLSFPVNEALPSALTRSQLYDIMEIEGKALYDLGSRNKKNVILFVHEGNKFIAFVPDNNSLEFDSMIACRGYLKSLGLSMKTSTISKRIKDG